jgi:hypothetical protein
MGIYDKERYHFHPEKWGAKLEIIIYITKGRVQPLRGWGHLSFITFINVSAARIINHRYRTHCHLGCT